MVSYVVTRWSSAYMMMERVRRLRPHLVPIIQSDLRDMPDCQIDWKSLDLLCKLLKPFYEATQDLQGEYYPTLSRVWRHLAKLRSLVTNFVVPRDRPEVEGVRQRLLAAMDEDSNYLKVDDLVRVATVLDPTMKVCAARAASVHLVTDSCRRRASAGR